VINSARDGLLLWFNNVLPALLPFIVVVNILVAIGFVRHVSAWASPFMKTVFKLPGAGGFALITGLVSGYPMGAKTIADLSRNGEITDKDAQRLMAFCNNAGPLFIIGVVGVGLLGDAAAGYALWAGHVMAAFVVGIYMRRYGEKNENNGMYVRHSNSGNINIGSVLGESVKNAMEALLLVGGLIIFFSVVTGAVTILLGSLNLRFMPEGLIAGALEVTGGVKLLADMAETPVSPLRMAGISGLIGFGGLSVHAQALHFTSGTRINARVYILHKAVGGVIAALITMLLWLAFQTYVSSTIMAY